MRLQAILAALLLAVPSVALAEDVGGYRLGFAQILGLFAVTLGPLKIVGPFGRLTRDLAPPALRRLALQSALIGTATVVGGGLLGSLLAANWGISAPIMTVCAGLVFFLVALRGVLAQYERPTTWVDDGPPSPFRVAFPIIVTPYGIAAVMVLLSLHRGDSLRMVHTIAALLLVMGINLAAMLWVRTLLRPLPAIALQLLGTVLGVLQVALALRILLVGLRDLDLAAALFP